MPKLWHCWQVLTVAATCQLGAVGPLVLMKHRSGFVLLVACHGPASLGAARLVVGELHAVRSAAERVLIAIVIFKVGAAWENGCCPEDL